MPGKTRVTFEGYRTTKRTVAMLKEARRVYGKGYPRIVQGGFNVGGVKASAGTHDRDALDFSVRGLSPANARRWEKCLWGVGFAAWRRTVIAGLWSAHVHAVPKGGDLSAGAQKQVDAFERRRDGLRGNRPYPSIGTFTHKTWEDYRPSDYRTVSLRLVQAAFRSQGDAGEDGREVQRALNKALGARLEVDGVLGSRSRSAAQRFQVKKFGPAGADGVLGRESLNRLGLIVT